MSSWKIIVALAGALVLSACGSTAVKSAQNDKTVQQTEAKVEAQVSKCMPTAGGAPDPLLLRQHSELVKFETCVGVSKNARSFRSCAFKVVLGQLPTVAGVEKGLTACVEENA